MKRGKGSKGSKGSLDSALYASRNYFKSQDYEMSWYAARRNAPAAQVRVYVKGGGKGPVRLATVEAGRPHLEYYQTIRELKDSLRYDDPPIPVDEGWEPVGPDDYEE